MLFSPTLTREESSAAMKAPKTTTQVTVHTWRGISVRPESAVLVSCFSVICGMPQL